MSRGSIIKRRWRDGKTVSYAIKYQLPDGRQKLETIGANKKQAERVLAARINGLDRGGHSELKEATFAEFARKWLREYAAPRVKPSTFDGYQRYIEKRLIPAFGTYPLRRLTTGRIEEFVTELLASGLSPKSVNNHLVPLKLMLRHAQRWGYLYANPAEPVERVAVPHQEMTALTPEQVRRLLAAADPDHWLLFTLACFTGLRRGELLGLRWGDVDWPEHRLRVARSVWRGQFISPKSKSGIRAVDLAPTVYRALRAARPKRPPQEIADELIFPGADGRPRDPDNMVRRRFLPALERAGLPRVRFHDLRHTFAALLVAGGEHPKYVQSQLGHASIQTTLDRYGHLLPGAYAHAGKRLEQTVLGGRVLPPASGQLSDERGGGHNNKPAGGRQK